MQATGGPRKAIVGTAMFGMYGGHPGLEARLEELGGLIDRMAGQAAEQYGGARLDLAALPEYAVGGGLSGPAAEVAYPLEGPVLGVIGGRARAHSCYVVLPLVLTEDREAGIYSNAAVLLGRRGEVVGLYRKVHVVPGPGPEELEGGLIGGQDFPVFECDFGRVAMQICYDMAFDEGWEVLGRKGAELIVWSSQWPGQISPSARALRHGYFVLTSTWRNNACLVDPTGHVIREIRGEDGVFVEQIDLDYVLLHWQAALKEGKAFDEHYGARAGYRYSTAEDSGIFWSNDPQLPIEEMVRALGLEPKPEQLARSRVIQDRLRGGPPRLD
jgi:predicted amidohydrolase